MPGLFAAGTDYTVLDDAETVTYYRRVTTSTFDAGTVCLNASREFPAKTEAGGNKSLREVRLEWLLWSSQVGSSPEPKVNDVIQDASGTRWSVTKVIVDAFVGTYSISTVQER